MVLYIIYVRIAPSGSNIRGIVEIMACRIVMLM